VADDSWLDADHVLGYAPMGGQDQVALIKEPGEVNRCREASRIVDVGHQAVHEAIHNGGYQGMTETDRD
jgi:hypothetical protein